MPLAPVLADGWIPGTPAFAGAGKARGDRGTHTYVSDGTLKLLAHRRGGGLVAGRGGGGEDGG